MNAVSFHSEPPLATWFDKPYGAHREHVRKKLDPLYGLAGLFPEEWAKIASLPPSHEPALRTIAASRTADSAIRELVKYAERQR